MALHVGMSIPDPDGDYRSPVLNRLGRLSEPDMAGRSSSRRMWRPARERSPSDATLLDLGERRLKDLQGAERISQLLHPELPTDFPPLATLDRRPHNLPVQPPRCWAGGDIRTIRQLLERRDGSSRLVTLTGPGGIGKTRLAMQPAAELVDVFNHGAFWVELPPLTDPALVPAAIAGVLGVAEEGGRPVMESLPSTCASGSCC